MLTFLSYFRSSLSCSSSLSSSRAISHLLLGGLCWCFAAQSGAGSLDDAVNSGARTAAYVERDIARHPQQTLAFFEVQPQHQVVEIWPGGGWYTEILAPYLAKSGRLYAAHFPMESPVGFFQRARASFIAKLDASPSQYRDVVVTQFHPPSQVEAAPEASVDRVLTFRNVHNWLKAGYEAQAFSDFYRVLKPGGVLGVVEHRAPEGTSKAQMIKSGYVSEAKVIALATAAGFEFAGRSEINANPKDSAQHPAGVWSLPPTLRLGEQDRARYVAIGESDRMTLKFVKAAAPQQ